VLKLDFGQHGQGRGAGQLLEIREGRGFLRQQAGFAKVFPNRIIRTFPCKIFSLFLGILFSIIGVVV
jgi:hypothetical protein